MLEPRKMAMEAVQLRKLAVGNGLAEVEDELGVDDQLSRVD